MKKCHILESGRGQDRGSRAGGEAQNGPRRLPRGVLTPWRGASAAPKREVSVGVSKPPKSEARHFRAAKNAHFRSAENAQNCRARPKSRDRDLGKRPKNCRAKCRVYSRRTGQARHSSIECQVLRSRGGLSTPARRSIRAPQDSREGSRIGATC